MEAGMKRAQLTPAAEEAALAAAASSVLVNGDLLPEILVRVEFPTNLVRAALVCRRWYRVASHPDFLRRFRDLHPPRLLGFYLSPSYYGGIGKRLLEFVPMLPQPSELATVLSRGSFSFNSYMRIYDCRNGRVLFGSYFPAEDMLMHKVQNPLDPMRSLVMLPQLDHKSKCEFCHRELLSTESGDEYFWFIVDFNMIRATEITVYKLQGGDWHIHALVATEVPSLPGQKSLLIEDKIYAISHYRSLLVLDLTSSSLSTIMLPDGVVTDRNTLLSRPNGSGVYLVQVKELQVCIWLLRGTHGSTGDWLMADMFCLRDMCANLGNPNCMTGDGVTADHVCLEAVGDNAEFLFLGINQSVLFLDVESRAMRKVYEYTDTELHGVRICPYMMIWPPIFPVPKE